MIVLRRTGIALALVAAALVACSAWLGYFGGSRYVSVPATASAPPRSGRIAAVIVSGDMGFKVGMGPQIARRLAERGIPVLGVNSLVYFRHKRKPKEIETFLADTIRDGLAFGHADKIFLIGQSFGADMVHVGLAGLPVNLRSKLAMVALIVPGNMVDYQASPLELAGLVDPDAPAYTTAKSLTWVPALCIRGIEETDSLCPLLHATNVHNVIMPGGHALNGDADGLFAQLYIAIQKSSVPQHARTR